MRYLIAHMIRGDAEKYHSNLSRAIASAYKLRPVTADIDPHLTIKAPFDALSTDLFEVERVVERFARARSTFSYELKQFGNFDDRVIYMGVEAPSEMLTFMQDIKEELRNIPWLEFKPHEADSKIHATLCYPRRTEQAREILEKLTSANARSFHCTFDTVAILKKGERRWELFKEYRLGGADDLAPIL